MADKRLIPSGIMGENTITINEIIDRIMKLNLQFPAGSHTGGGWSKTV